MDGGRIEIGIALDGTHLIMIRINSINQSSDSTCDFVSVILYFDEWDKILCLLLKKIIRSMLDV